MRNERMLNALGNCINHCNYCADACLEEDNLKMMKDCIRTDKICAEVCSALNTVLATGYQNVEGLVRYCMEICNSCAHECSKHDHEHCQKCAEACRECVEACEQYLS